MRTFISNIAQSLYRDYGDNISSLTLLFPSRRARLFFNESLAELSSKPLWQPDFTTIDTLMEGISGVRRSDNLRLIAELYKVYSRHHNEPFDSFYFWGEMLLSDFDSIDKYLIDARTLFVNIAELKSMESDLSYLSAEQVEIIRRFWSNFNTDDLSSPEKAHFVKIWNSLLSIYEEFRAVLSRSGMAYAGMIYRQAAEKLRSGDVDESVFERKYVIAGFNALSETEKILFKSLEKRGCVHFFWDYDKYYTSSSEQEAGLFLRDNIARFSAPNDDCDNFLKPKEIVAVAAPSDVMQCKYVYDFLRSIDNPDKETAIILTDENLLLPVLHSIPEEVEKINITMGYPLRQTPAYTFVERLLELQQRVRKRGDKALFYHTPVLGVLNHPYLRNLYNDRSEEIVREINARQQIYIPSELLSELEFVFSAQSGWESLCDYIVSVMEHLKPGVADKDMQGVFFDVITENLVKLKNVLLSCGIVLSVGVFYSLVRKVLQSVRIPYDGEPLEGVQVMGILETRNLDFENVVILSANDDTFPGNLSASSSFVPYNLRLAYGLPTPLHHEGVFGYYFYRVIQRAKRVHIVYSVKSDDKKTGEASRYIYQLDYESPHEVVKRSLSLNVNMSHSELTHQEKTPEIMERLMSFTQDRKLSPSSFYAYVECPMKFYYKSVLRLREEDEISEEVDLPMFGNILHKAAELLYEPYVGKPLGKIDTQTIEKCVVSAIESEYFKSGSVEMGGNMTMIRDIVCKYLKDCLLKYDYAHNDFVVKSLEENIEAVFDVNGLKVRLGGKSDRIDLMKDGSLRIVDYKTGAMRLEFKGVEALFADDYFKRNSAVLQTMIYSLMLSDAGASVVPALYYIRYLNTDNYSPALIDKSEERRPRTVERFLDYKDEFIEVFKRSLSELFDPSVPFSRCVDLKTCEHCPYIKICR